MPQEKQKQKRWWQKEIPPTVSFIFLIFSLLVVFLMGILFMREYTRIWMEISKMQNEIFSSNTINNQQQVDLDKELKKFQDIVVP